MTIQWIARRLAQSLAALSAAVVLYFNVALYCSPSEASFYEGCELYRHLQFLKNALRYQGAGEQAQAIYPEGYIFIHALYALAWCDAAKNLPLEHALRKEAAQEAAFALEKMDSAEGKSVFSSELPLEYGAFYSGWVTYARGRYSAIAPWDTVARKRFIQNCASIAQAKSGTENPLLESYHQLTWPADNMVCLAALSLHDKIVGNAYEAVRQTWLEQLRQISDKQYRLIPHGYDLGTGRSLDGVRGSSQALMLVFLSEVDPKFSQNQYSLFRQYFLDYKFGLPGVREYPRGADGDGDIDAGPIVMGIGGAATLVGIKAAARHNDWEVWEGLRHGSAAWLLPSKKGEIKRYLGGRFPVADAFMAWSNAELIGLDPTEMTNWRWKFQVFSLAFLGFVIGVWRLVR